MIIELLNIHDIDIETLRTGVSEKRLEKSNRYSHTEDVLRSLSVEYLLNQMIQKNHPEIPVPVTLQYDEKGKPHLKNSNGHEPLFISLSHSGDYVVCMLDTVPCGVDIELCKEKHYKKILNRICSENEIKLVKSLSDFYNIWTLKESVLKATGKGLSLDMKSFEFKIIGDKYETTVHEKKYAGQVVSDINSYPAGYSLSYVRLV